MTNYYLQYALVIPSQRWAGSFSQFLFAMECFFFSYSSSSSLWVNRLNHSSLEYTPCTIRSLSWCTIRVLVFWLFKQRTSLKIVTKTSIFGIDQFCQTKKVIDRSIGNLASSMTIKSTWQPQLFEMCANVNGNTLTSCTFIIFQWNDRKEKWIYTRHLTWTNKFRWLRFSCCSSS